MNEESGGERQRKMIFRRNKKHPKKVTFFECFCVKWHTKSVVQNCLLNYKSRNMSLVVGICWSSPTDKSVPKGERTGVISISWKAWTKLDTQTTQPQENIASLVVRMDDCEWLYTAINKLPDLRWRRLYLYFFDGLTYRQIAEIEGVGFKTVFRSVERAKNTLRKLYTE